MRGSRFEDVPGILRLIDRALEHGCRDHYDERQRRAVYLGYASSLFIDALGPFETLVCEIGDRLVGATQIDPGEGLLRALFVAPELQGHGLGGALLAAAESCARTAGCRQLVGAMSLNAVPFYRRAGFRAQSAPQTIHGAFGPVPVQWMVKSLA